VAREQLEGFVAALKDAFASFFPTVAGNADLTAVVNERHLARVEGYLADAVARGARVESSPAEPVAGRRCPLRIVIDPPAGARIHARARVKSVDRLKSGTQLVLEVHTHVVGAERPSVINDLVILYM